ncbi:MAG: glycosyltransferase [Acidimicrobiales bacterium]|nr:glycosyltransferase [Acidimicrobiales bacterium]
MRISLDATPLLDTPTGVGVFTREVLRRLGARPDVDVTAFSFSFPRRRSLKQVLPPGVDAARFPMPARVVRPLLLGNYPVVIDWLTGPCDVVHGPNFVTPPTRAGVEVVTVHDLTFLRFPKMCTIDTLAYPPLIRRTIDRGGWIHTVSEFVANEVRDAFPIDPERVVVVPNGVNPPSADGPGRDAAAGQRLARGKSYVLAVGTVEPRKDLSTLVSAFDQLAADDPDLRLVIAGPDGWGMETYTEAAAAARFRDRIVRLGWVDDDQRTALMRGAAAVAYPSRYEGFGLVPLEAMALGTPVVTTATGALPEVVADAAVMVPATDVDALAGALASVLGDPERRADLIARGHQRAASFTWEATADGLVDLYHQAYASR